MGNIDMTEYYKRRNIISEKLIDLGKKLKAKDCQVMINKDALESNLVRCIHVTCNGKYAYVDWRETPERWVVGVYKQGIHTLALTGPASPELSGLFSASEVMSKMKHANKKHHQIFTVEL